MTDSTRIRHLETKKFLASIETKRELSRYLADKVVANLEKKFVFVVDRTCFSDLADLDESLKTYDQEEADTGIFLHAIHVCKRDPFSELTIRCSDTEVLLILLNYFEQLPSTTFFKTTEHRYSLRQIFMLNFEDLIQKVNETIYLSLFYISNHLTQIHKALFIYHMQFFQKVLVSTIC